MEIPRIILATLGIDQLRVQADFTPYEPVAETPAWMRHLAKVARDDLGTLAVLGPAGISVETGDGARARLKPDPSGLYISALADSIRATQNKLAVGTPPLGRYFPLLLASTVVLANTLELARGSKRDGRVLVISPDLDLRSHYCGLYVRKEMLDDAHPGSRMRPNGDTTVLRQHAHEINQERGVCFFLPNLNLPDRMQFMPSLIVLDFRFSRWVKRAQALTVWATALKCSAGLLALYTLGDQDTVTALVQSGFLDIPFDHSAIATCSRKVSAPKSNTSLPLDCSFAAAPDLLNRRHVVEEILGADRVEEIYTQVARLLHEQRATSSLELNRARWILATLVHMPVPISWYEQSSRNTGRSTIKRLIETLGSRSRLAKGLGPILQTVRMILLQLYSLIDADNPRVGALKILIERVALDSGAERILLLVRDRMSEEALDSWLSIQAFSEAEWLQRVEVRGCPAYFEVANTQYSHVLVNGAIPRRYNWISGAALGLEVVFLAYPHESDIIEHQLRSVYDEKKIRARSHARSKSIARLLNFANEQTVTDECRVPALILKRPVRGKANTDSPLPIKSSRGLAGLGEALNAARRSAENVKSEQAFRESLIDLDSGEEDVSDIDNVAVSDSESSESVEVLGFRVQSRHYGGGMLYLQLGSFIECVRPSQGEDVLRIEVQKIKVGDVILRSANSTHRTTLFDRLVDLAEGQPEMEYLAEFRRVWRTAVQKIAAKFRCPSGIDYGAAFGALKQAGAPIESEQAIKFWLHDQVIGPEAVDSIAAVGQVSGSVALVGQAKHFDRAFRKIRGIHQGIGRRLSGVIRESFQHLHFGHSKRHTESLDDRLGIPLDELLDNLDLAEVVTINPLRENMPSHLVGQIISNQKTI